VRVLVTGTERYCVCCTAPTLFEDPRGRTRVNEVECVFRSGYIHGGFFGKEELQ
jgi:hypothetical protein